MKLSLDQVGTLRQALEFVVMAKREGMMDHPTARDFLTEVLQQVGFEKKDSAGVIRRG